MESGSQSRPRPKPKPKAKTGTSAVPRPSAVPGSSRIPQEAAQIPTARDEDELFMRNRKRTGATWQRLKEIDNKTKVEVINDESDGERPWKNKKKRPNVHVGPRWQRMLSEQLSDKSDDDILEVDPPQSPVRSLKGKERSRSRSVTPPPNVPIQELLRARNLVRQALDLPPRASSPEILDVDASTDTIVLNPELASLAKFVELQSLQRDSRSIPHHTSELDTIKIIVSWQPHPKDTNGAPSCSAYTMNRDESLRALFEAVADEYEILPQNLVMTHKGNRLYSSTSPRALNVWTEAEFVACDIATHTYMRVNSLAEDGRHPSPVHPPVSRTPSGSTRAETIEVDSDDDIVIAVPQPIRPIQSSPTQPQNQIHDSDAESEADSDKFKIALQSALTQGKHITLTVRPTTKCGAIVKAFLKKAGLADQYPHIFGGTVINPPTKKRGRKNQAPPPKDPRICVDGEKMSNDAAIGEADLEDGDMVEVVGL